MSGFETPVVFIIFNRADHVQQVFDEIRKAKPAKLLVIADGPRNDVEAAKCKAARAIIEQVDWECDVLRNFSDENLGCRKRISSGLDWVFEQVEEAIILEDDCVPSQSFFPYCETMLERFRDDPRIMMVCGSNFLQDRLNIPETYTFSRHCSVWGWATWRRAWAIYDRDMPKWPEYKAQGQMDGLLPYDRPKEFLAFHFDKIATLDSWATPWHFTFLFNNALSVVPRVNLISNVGLVGAHFSGGNPDVLNLPLYELDLKNVVHPEHVFPDQRYDRPFMTQNSLFVLGKPLPLWYRAARRVWRMAKRLVGIKPKG